MKFEDYKIADEIKKSIEKSGFKRPTDIQFKTIPHILNSEDLLAIAQTGTGKTAAFVIPLLHKIHVGKIKKRTDGIKCIVMVPTRELAMQIGDVFKNLGAKTKVNILAVFGGVEQDPQIAKLEKGTDVLIATPGRLFDLVSQGHIHLNRVETLILDEADQMLDLGFYKDIEDLIRFLPKYRQTLFFSATINKKIKKLAYSLINSKAIRIQISPKDPVSKNVTHSVAFIDMDDKRFFLEHLYNTHEGSKILVFVRTKVRAERVQKAMERVNIKAECLHGEINQKDRIETLNKFKSGELKLLIATDVSARGIDIPGVEYVINYDLPEVAEQYVHRIGRTGRGNNKGIAISFCAKEERELLKAIEEILPAPINREHISKNEYNEILDTKKETDGDWKSVLNDINDFQEMVAKKKKKKKKK